MKVLLALIMPAVLGLGAGEALAWGATGHHMIAELALEQLPPELPAFLHTTDVPFVGGELAREPDRSKGSGNPHDADLDPGHRLKLDDTGKVMGGPPLAALPETREAFDTSLRAVGHTQYETGYLAYNIVEGWQQLTKDFAYWRVLVAAERNAADPAVAARFSRDRQIREMLILRDLGVWSHFIGDGSQPMHLSVHYDGWGDFPNPQGFTNARIHGPFEGEFVRRFITPAEVSPLVAPPRDSNEPITERTATYLGETHAALTETFELAGPTHDFSVATPEAEGFVAARLAAAVAEVRDLTVMAWHASETMPVGWPEITLDKVEAGADPTGPLFGLD